MSAKFDPRNPIIQLCMKGMAMEESGDLDGAMDIFLKAWDQTSDDYERFIVAYHLGIRQENVDVKLVWMEKSLGFALKINDENVRALSNFILQIAKCYEELNDTENARKISNYPIHIKANQLTLAHFSWNKGRSTSWRFTDSG